MLDTKNTKSLIDFTDNLQEHLERLKVSGAPELLTVDGEVAFVVQDPVAYQKLVEKAESLETIEAIRAGMAEHEQGEGVNFQAAIQKLAAKKGVVLNRKQG